MFPDMVIHFLKECSISLFTITAAPFNWYHLGQKSNSDPTGAPPLSARGFYYYFWFRFSALSIDDFDVQIVFDNVIDGVSSTLLLKDQPAILGIGYFRPKTSMCA